MGNFVSCIVEFYVSKGKNKKKISFAIIHNLPEIKGLSLEDAVNNWVFRTQEYTAESLCIYINNKGTGYTARAE